MAARLTDKQKKKIIADYVELRSYNATGKINGVAPNTVKKLVQGNAEIAEMCDQKREENTIEMLEYMDSRKGEAQGIIDLYLKALADPDKLNGATLAQIATALGIIVDKFTKTSEAYSSDKPGIMDKIVEAVKNIE